MLFWPQLQAQVSHLISGMKTVILSIKTHQLCRFQAHWQQLRTQPPLYHKAAYTLLLESRQTRPLFSKQCTALSESPPRSTCRLSASQAVQDASQDWPNQSKPYTLAEWAPHSSSSCSSRDSTVQLDTKEAEGPIAATTRGTLPPFVSREGWQSGQGAGRALGALQRFSPWLPLFLRAGRWPRDLPFWSWGSVRGRELAGVLGGLGWLELRLAVKELPIYRPVWEQAQLSKQQAEHTRPSAELARQTQANTPPLWLSVWQAPMQA